MIKKSCGFTLIELLVGLAIFSIIITLIISSKINQTGQGISQQQAVEMQQTARSVIHLMAHQLRRAGYNPHYKDYGPGFTTADASTLTFTYVDSDDGNDNDGDGQIDEDGELSTITYALQDDDGDGDNDIRMTFNTNTQLLAENITTMTFTYFNENGNSIPPVGNANLDTIRSVGINVTVRVDANELDRLAANNTRSLSTRVSPRNLGF